jgi:DNA-binding CsgD family transcriptional regulator
MKSSSLKQPGHDCRAQFDHCTSVSVEGLVRLLVETLASGNSPGLLSACKSDNDVILDVKVDCVRCLLLRVPAQLEHPALYLSPREREIARMVARGYPNKTIARVLEISIHTVGTYLKRVFAKLNVGSRAAMVARLMEEGLLKEEL